MQPSSSLPAGPDVAHWHAGYNQPGYLPEAEPGVYTSFYTASDNLAEDMEAARRRGRDMGRPPRLRRHPMPHLRRRLPLATSRRHPEPNETTWSPPTAPNGQDTPTAPPTG